MAIRLSKEDRRKISATLEREEEQKKAQRKAMDEMELRKLARETRMMKEAKLRDGLYEKQVKVKKLLSSEKDNLLDNLKMMKSASRCISDMKQAQDITNLFAQGDDLDAAIALEKKYIADLESQINKETKNIYIQKKERGDAIGNSEYLQTKENEKADRTLESWKIRLDAEQAQLSSVIKENEEMRNKLQSLLREKGQFNNLFDELMMKLTQGKKVMADIVERSHQQFQNRDEVYRKIDALKSRDKADLAKRTEEMQEMEIRLYEDKRLAVFRNRIQMCRQKLEGGKLSAFSHKGTLDREKLLKRFEKANEFWAKLKEVTGQANAAEISKHIITEDENLFRLFNFNNEIRAQLDVLTNKTADLLSSVNEERSAAEDHMEAVVRATNSMKRNLETVEQDTSDLTDVYDANARLFNRLLNKVQIVFDFMGCKTSTLEELLGNNTEVTEHNYRLFLGLIETQLIKLLEMLGKGFMSKSAIFSYPSRMDISSTVTGKSIFRTKLERSILPSKKVLTRACFECDAGKTT